MSLVFLLMCDLLQLVVVLWLSYHPVLAPMQVQVVGASYLPPVQEHFD